MCASPRTIGFPEDLTPEDAAEVARLFKAAGADVIDCSSGQVSKAEQPVYGRMFQVPFSDRIRNEVGIPTDRRGQYFRGRSREHDHRRRPRRSVRDRAAASGRSRVDAA